jgi:hypothetical protein
MSTLAEADFLDAYETVEQAGARLQASSKDWVVVRRTLGLVVFWYAFPRRRVIESFGYSSPSTRINEALNLHEHDAAPVRGADELNAPPHHDMVVRGPGDFLGVLPKGVAPDPALQGIGAVKERKTKGKKPALEPQPAHLPWTHIGTVTGVGSPVTAGVRDADLLTAEVGDVELTGGAAGTGAARSSAFSAYPELGLPTTLPARMAFDLTVGLAQEKQAGTQGDALVLDLPVSVTQVHLDLCIIADGFEMPKGNAHSLVVDRFDPYSAKVSIPMVAPDLQQDQPMLTSVSVLFYHEGVPCGLATRKTAVIPAGSQPFSDAKEHGRLWVVDQPSGSPVSIKQGVPAADLTVSISRPDDNPGSGRFVWTFESPHFVPLPKEPISRNLGQDAQSFATHLIADIAANEAKGTIDLHMRGLGKQVVDRMPPEFPDILREVAKAVEKKNPGRVPSVLLLTAEARMPWELALIDPPLDPQAPPYLGCQVDLARWPLTDTASPALPPPNRIQVEKLAVVIGDYASSNRWRDLEFAKKEGEFLKTKYHAIPLFADVDGIKHLLFAKLPPPAGTDGAELVHFACHGEALSGNALDAAIILAQDHPLSPVWFSSTALGTKHQPFLFLNACQVGQGQELLGSVSGFAGESLKGGFRGFLGPLWSVDDELAHHIAVEFYDRVFGTDGKQPETVASILRDIRRRYSPGQEKNSSTRLAYVYYGHPGLTITRK